MTIDRRRFLTQTTAAATLAALGSRGLGQDAPVTARAADAPIRRTRFAVSTSAFWQFRNEELRDVEKCIDLAAEMGFDGVEILHRQMQQEANDYLQRLKRRAFIQGLDLCGFATH